MDKKTPEKYPKNSPYDCFTSFKGDLLCKNHFIKVFEHSCVAAMCENNMPIIVKSTHKFFYNLQNHKQSLRTVSDCPSVHVTEGKKSRPFVTLPYRHTPEWEAAVRFHYGLLAVAAGGIYV